MRPRLSLAVSAFNAADRLPLLIAQGRACGAEIVIGVDAACNDNTWPIAVELADVAYRYAHTGSAVPARLLPLRFARTPWILSLDDDEWLEPTMPDVLAELTGRDDYTHAYFARKWLVRRDPLEYVTDAPWYPDWQLRLFRNDASLVERPLRVHAGFQVMGPGVFEPRAAILHLDSLIRSNAERLRKVEQYARLGSGGEAEEFYRSTAGRAVAPAAVLEGRAEKPRAHSVHHDDIAAVRDWNARPGWRAAIRVEMPTEHTGPRPILAEVEAVNTGTLSWIRSDERWPFLNLGFHLCASDGRVLAFDGERFPIRGRVAPGESTRWHCRIAPPPPGNYLLEWDLVSEGECWFCDCGSPTTVTRIRIT